MEWRDLFQLLDEQAEELMEKKQKADERMKKAEVRRERGEREWGDISSD